MRKAHDRPRPGAGRILPAFGTPWPDREDAAAVRRHAAWARHLERVASNECRQIHAGDRDAGAPVGRRVGTEPVVGR